MRVALCLSGQPRGLPLSCSRTYWALLKKNPNIDVFFHTWFDPATVGKSFDSAQLNQNGKVGVVHPDTEKILLDTYQPKKFIIEPQRAFSEFSDLPSTAEANPTKLASLWYSMYKANELKTEYELENNFKYDWIIRTRFDLWYYNQLKPAHFEVSNNYLWVPETFQQIRQQGALARTLTDVFAMSSSENMDIFTGVFPNYRKYVIEDKVYPPFGENILGWHNLIQHHQEVRLFPFQIDLMQRVVNINRLDYEPNLF